MNSHKNSNNPLPKNTQVFSQPNYLAFYNYQNIPSMLNQNVYNQYLLNMSMMANKPFPTPDGMFNVRENYPFLNKSNGMDIPSQEIGMGMHSNYFDYLYHGENMRVAMIEHRKKNSCQVINLVDSDEEEQTEHKSIQVSTNQREVNEIKIVELDDQSQEKIGKMIRPSVSQANLQAEKKLEIAIDKNDSFEAKKRELFEDLKRKRIQKPSKKFTKRSIIYESHKNKSELIEESFKIQFEEKSRKTKEKILKPCIQEGKKKCNEGPVREIAKYMDSHGEIRHGREFQSEIPNPLILPHSCKEIFDLGFKEWLCEKRLSILKREVGVLTY